MFRTIFRTLRHVRRARYAPLVFVRISKDVVRLNLTAFQKAYGHLRIAPVLKSNAYGHGLVGIARLLDSDGLPFFCVDTYAEALILRNEGIITPLLILGYTLPENIAHCRLRNVMFTITSIEMLGRLVASNINCECHLKIDTGMHRQGIMIDEVPRAFELLQKKSRVRVAGIMTHLADPDGDDPAFTQAQIAVWNETVALMKKNFPAPIAIHCSATEGSRYAASIDATILRLGIGLYGCAAGIPVATTPALELVSTISAVRTLNEGEKIGYNITYTAPRTMHVATIPVGYAEGVDRRLSNRGTMLVRGTPCPIIGRVSMNMTTLDVTDVTPAVCVGDEVVVISASREDLNSCESIARLCETIPYEILVHIPSSLRRIYN